MKQIRFCPILFFGLLFSFESTAQKNFQPGLVIMNDGTTIRGFINYKEWNKTPSSIEFTINETDIRNLSPADISYFEVTGAEKFERYSGFISMDKVSLQNLRGYDTSQREVTVFMKILSDGKVSLLKYEDDIKERYFIRTQPGSRPVELLYKKYYAPDKTTEFREVKGYISQLTQIADSLYPGNRKISYQIENARYAQRYLLPIVNQFNNENQSKPEQGEKKFKRALLYAGTGIHISDFIIQALPFTDAEYSFNTSVSPLISGGVNFYTNPRTRKFFAKLELSAFLHSYKGSLNNLHDSSNTYRYDYRYTLQQAVFSTAFFASYNIYKTKQTDVYIGTGPALYISATSSNKQHQTRTLISNPSNKDETDFNALKLESAWFSAHFRAGVVIRKRFDLSASYSSVNSQGSYSLYQDAANYFEIRFNYLFSDK